MPKILCFDTTNDESSAIAIVVENKIISKKESIEKNRQAELLIPNIENIMKQNKNTYKDFNTFAVTTGPGSFTGIRIGLSVAKTLKLILDKPIVTCSLFEVLGYNQSKNAIIIVKYGMNYFVRIQDTFKVFKKEELLEFLKEQGKNIAIISNCKILEIPSMISIDQNKIIDLFCLLAYKKFENSDFDNEIKPLYIRPVGISLRRVVL